MSVKIPINWFLKAVFHACSLITFPFRNFSSSPGQVVWATVSGQTFKSLFTKMKKEVPFTVECIIILKMYTIHVISIK